MIFSDTLYRNIIHPQNFGTLLIYYRSTIFQFLDSIYWMEAILFFTCVMVEVTWVTWPPPMCTTTNAETYLRTPRYCFWQIRGHSYILLLGKFDLHELRCKNILALHQRFDLPPLPNWGIPRVNRGFYIVSRFSWGSHGRLRQGCTFLTLGFSIQCGELAGI